LLPEAWLAGVAWHESKDDDAWYVTVFFEKVSPFYSKKVEEPEIRPLINAAVGGWAALRGIEPPETDRCWGQMAEAIERMGLGRVDGPELAREWLVSQARAGLDNQEPEEPV
jgi:hypothetical protein